MVNFVIGITGGSGVGKTTLINKLYDAFPGEVSTFSLDNYYKPKTEQEVDDQGVINFDLPSALNVDDMEADLQKLVEGQTVQRKQYMFNNPAAEAGVVIVEPKHLLIVEGIFVMHYPFIRERLDYSVFLTVDADLQLERRLKRDMEERNYSKEEVMYQWDYHVQPAFEKYVEPHIADVDLVINNNSHFDDNIHTLMDVIKKNINK